MAQLKLSEIKGPLADLNDKLSGENGMEWLDAFKKFLRKENPWAAEPAAVAATAWSVWKTVTLGEQKDDKTCAKALEQAGFKISRWTGDLLGKTTFSSQKQDVDLVRVTVRELGFHKGASLKEIYARAQERGLDLCSPEVGPALRLAYTDQPAGEWISVAMEALTGSGGDLNIFVVNHDSGGLWLSAYCDRPHDVWHAEFSFVFLRRK